MRSMNRMFVLALTLAAITAGCARYSSPREDAAATPVSRPTPVGTVAATYALEVTSLEMPPMRELEGSFDYVSQVFDGREWVFHPSCQALMPGHRDLALVAFDRPVRTNEAISWGAERGFRPATHVELIALGKAHPEIHKEIAVFALGSTALNDLGLKLRDTKDGTIVRARHIVLEGEDPVHGAGSSVALLGNGSGGRDLDEDWIGERHLWYPSCKILFVRI